MNFNLIKSFTIDTDDGTLRYEGMGVNHLNDRENHHTFAFLGEQHDDFYFLAEYQPLPSRMVIV